MVTLSRQLSFNNQIKSLKHCIRSGWRIYCSSSQLLLIRLVGPPDVVAVVAVAVAEAVEKQSSGLVPWFTSLSPHTSVPCPGVSSLRQEIPTQYWDSSVVLRGLQSEVFTPWSPAGEWGPWAPGCDKETCLAGRLCWSLCWTRSLAGSWGVVCYHTLVNSGQHGE